MYIFSVGVYISTIILTKQPCVGLTFTHPIIPPDKARVSRSSSSDGSILNSTDRENCRKCFPPILSSATFGNRSSSNKCGQTFTLRSVIIIGVANMSQHTTDKLWPGSLLCRFHCNAPDHTLVRFVVSPQKSWAGGSCAGFATKKKISVNANDLFMNKLSSRI